jgi:DNA-directed RNA polymerase subunit M/transcription elongation factor TFIIS
MSYRLAVSKILASPLGPGFSRTCPACHERFALELQQKCDHPIANQVATYRCKACGHEVEFAKEHPPNAV